MLIFLQKYTKYSYSGGHLTTSTDNINQQMALEVQEAELVMEIKPLLSPF